MVCLYIVTAINLSAWQSLSSGAVFIVLVLHSYFYPIFFQGKVKVRRASISEPSDTEHEPQALPLSAGEACHLP